MSCHKMTVWHYVKTGKIPGTKTASGHWYLDTNDIDKFMSNTMEITEKGVAIYTRVSSSQNKTNLETQAKRLEDFCLTKGWKIACVVKEIGSGMNDSRPKFINLIKHYGDYDKIVVEHKDRLTRFGFNIISTFVDNIYVVNESDDTKENLTEDLISIITSYCSKIYGQRKSKRKTEKLIEEIKSNAE